MKTIILNILFILFGLNTISQNIKSEIISFSEKLNGVEYSTYHFVNASYSYSRLPLIFVTDKKNFDKAFSNVPSLFKSKQEYTDIYILGINGFNNLSVKDSTNPIINLFANNISKYRIFNNLPHYDVATLLKEIIYTNSANFLCEHLICRNINKRKSK